MGISKMRFLKVGIRPCILPQTDLPRLESDTDCEFHISWDTPAACPLEPPGPTTGGDGCTYNDPDSNYVYNLEPLSKKDYSVTVGGAEYKVGN